MRWIIAILIVAGLAMQMQLWFSADGYRKTHDLRAATQNQRQLNEKLKARNIALEAEVINLKHHRDAAEERARTDLGMIGKNETYFQVVPMLAAFERDNS